VGQRPALTRREPLTALDGCLAAGRSAGPTANDDRLDAAGGDEVVDVVGVDADVAADLVEGDAPFGDEASDEPHGSAEASAASATVISCPAVVWLIVGVLPVGVSG
jgi:hypothetical protein